MYGLCVSPLDVNNLFPDFFTTPLSLNVLGKALDQEIAKVNVMNPRDYTTDKHNKKEIIIQNLY